MENPNTYLANRYRWKALRVAGASTPQREPLDIQSCHKKARDLVYAVMQQTQRIGGRKDRPSAAVVTGNTGG